MIIKKGDKVIVLSGKDRNKKGTVEHVFHDTDKVVVSGVNMMKRHEKPRQSGKKGSIVERPGVIHVSNVALVDPSTGKGTRVRMQGTGTKKARVAVKSGSAI